MDFLELLQRDLIRDEGLRLKPYHCTADKLTIGVGRNLDDNGISKAEAMMMLDSDIMNSVAELSQSFIFYPDLTQNQQRALINMHFNLGLTRLKTFKNMLAELSRGNGEKAAKEALNSKWAMQVGSRANRIADLLKG